MDSEQFHIFFLEEAKPFCVCTPKSIPFAYRDKLQAKLQLLQDQNIIAPEPTAWCTSIVVTPKKELIRSGSVWTYHTLTSMSGERDTNHSHPHRQWQTLHQTKQPFSPS